MASYHRRRRFGNRPRSGGVTVSSTVAKRKVTCRACRQPIFPGDPMVTFRLKKSLRAPCASCAHKPVGKKCYHPTCQPTDANLAMGYDPNHRPAHNTAPPVDDHKIAPPPKPQTFNDACFAFMLAGENALKRALAENPALQKDAELAETLKTYNGCKSRALRPGTPSEGTVAMKMALKKVLDVVFRNV